MLHLFRAAELAEVGRAFVHLFLNSRNLVPQMEHGTGVVLSVKQAAPGSRISGVRLAATIT